MRTQKIHGLTRGKPIDVVTVDGLGAMGAWSPEEKRIYLDASLGDGERLVTLIHEVLHVTETHLGKRIPHAYVEAAGFAVAHALASTGATKITKRQWAAAIKRMKKGTA